MKTREIKFRGFSKHLNKWVYGDLLHLEKDFVKYCAIIDWSQENANVMVEDGSVGQWTGFTDNHGREIFEGDRIAEIYRLSELKKWGDPLTVMFGEYSDGPDSWGLDYCTTGFYCKYKDGEMTGLNNRLEGAYGFRANDVMIVGNIYENPELLNETVERETPC